MEDKPNENGEFCCRKVTKLPADFTLLWREFHGVGKTTEKDLDPLFVLTRGVIR